MLKLLNPIKITNKEALIRINNDEDFIAIEKFRYSLKELLIKYSFTTLGPIITDD